MRGLSDDDTESTKRHSCLFYFSKSFEGNKTPLKTENTTIHSLDKSTTSSKAKTDTMTQICAVLTGDGGTQDFNRLNQR